MASSHMHIRSLLLAAFASIAVPPLNGGERKKKAASKTKYTCPTCGANTWAKPETKLICGVCYQDDRGEVTLLQPEVSSDDTAETQELVLILFIANGYC